MRKEDISGERKIGGKKGQRERLINRFRRQEAGCACSYPIVDVVQAGRKQSRADLDLIVQ